MKTNLLENSEILRNLIKITFPTSYEDIAHSCGGTGVLSPGKITPVPLPLTNPHLVRLVLALLAILALVTTFNQSVAKLVKIPYAFDSSNIRCEDHPSHLFLIGLIANSPSILHGTATLSRPTKETEALHIGELGMVPYSEPFHWSSEICGDMYCVNENLLSFSNGNGHMVTLQYRVSRDLAIKELRVRVALQNAETTSVCSATLPNSIRR